MADDEKLNENPAEVEAPAPQLPVETRLKLARGILDRTCTEAGAGYILIMFVPGTDLVLRSFRGLDSVDECVAAANEVRGLLTAHATRLEQAGKNGAKQLHNDA